MKLHALLLLMVTPTYLFLNPNNNLFKILNQNVQLYKAQAAELIWESYVNPNNPELPEQIAEFHKEFLKWEEDTCKKLVILHEQQLLNETQTLQLFLLCRGTRFNSNESSHMSHLCYDLKKIYLEAEICIPSENTEIKNIQQLDIAILKYKTKVNNFKNEHNVNSTIDDSVSLDAKMANKDNEKGFCLIGDVDFEKVMEMSRNEAVLKWIWQLWREKVGPTMKEPYRQLVEIANVGVRRKNYKNLGEFWRDELEIPRLRHLCRQLYYNIRPLYTVLHGVVRFYLRRFYGEIVPERGPIPAHLLGNLWSQSWEPLIDLITPNTINLNKSIRKLNWTALDMARKAEDFYQSLGLPAMTDAFWRESVFAWKNKEMPCHGIAMDMFKDGDFRMIYCSWTTMEDFYAFHHEMGHIQYFMAYEKQPALFRSANEALHESIGDAVMNGVMTPQHLHRLGLLNDSLLYGFDENDDTNADNNERIQIITYADNNDDKNAEKKDDELTKEVYKGYFSKRNSGRGSEDFDGHINVEKDKSNNFEKEKDNLIDSFGESLKTDEILLLKQALNSVPQIPFTLLIEEYRWRYFEGGISKRETNRHFWEMATELQGIAPSNDRGEEYFDIGAHFHVLDNTPNIRYFLSSFLRHQLFETLCKAAVYGRRTNDDLPESIPLNRCDIYGSKTAGNILNQKRLQGAGCIASLYGKADALRKILTSSRVTRPLTICSDIRDIMSRGHHQHWSVILQEVTGNGNISASSLVRYYRPLYEKLLKLVRKYDIPIGWKEVTKTGWYFA